MSRCPGIPGKDRDFIPILLGNVGEGLFQRVIVLRSLAALDDTLLFCCIFDVHDYDMTPMAL